MYDDLGDRMKRYEQLALPDRFIPKLPVVIRLDGVAFHTFTNGLQRPYDKRLVLAMQELLSFLIKETNAKVGYHQSDELSLLLYSDNPKSQIYFDGRIQKILSVLPARASLYFNQILGEFLPEKKEKNPVFDCRAFVVPTKEEAANAFLWRELDATKNSISMAAQSLFSHKELQGKHSNQMQDMMHQKGVNWNDYPDYFKRGTFMRQEYYNLPFTSCEIEQLPEKHEARTNPNLLVRRKVMKIIKMPPFSKVDNRVDVLFDGAVPQVEE